MARIGLVAHDDKKDELVAWAIAHRDTLAKHELWGTGTSGGRVNAGTGLKVSLLKSGPLGGDAQQGAMICEGRLDVFPGGDPVARVMVRSARIAACSVERGKVGSSSRNARTCSPVRARSASITLLRIAFLPSGVNWIEMIEGSR